MIAREMIGLAKSAQSEPVKLAAQKSVLEHLVSLSEFGDLKARLEDLESWRRENQPRDSQ